MFTKKPMNPLFPISITAGSVATAFVVGKALAPEAGAFETAGCTLLATLLALAVLEHWFLLLPLPSSEHWCGWPRTHAPRGIEPSGVVVQRTFTPPGSERELVAYQGSAFSVAPSYLEDFAGA